MKRLALALALTTPGCFAPVLRPVKPPGPGEVVVSASYQGPDLLSNSLPVEVGATAAVGLAPHWALQAEASWDPALEWSVGGGLRYTRPIDDWKSVDVSVSYDQISVKPVHCNFETPGLGGVESATANDDSDGVGTIEAGLLLHKPDSVLWTGIWFDATLGEAYRQCTLSSAGQGPTFNDGAGLRLGFDLVPPGSFLHLLLGASAMVPGNWPSQFGSQVQFDENSEQLDAWFTVGLGLAAYF